MDEVALIREKLDIVSFIQEYIPLKKAGKNFKANCPFHNEKTPSFIVSPDRQTWHCFGCSKHGDIYSFLMEYERMEFPEALRILAKRAGIELTQRAIVPGVNSKKEKLYQINILAREYYHYVLTKHPAGQKALEYLIKRGIEPKIIETFQLGFSPATGTALSQYLVTKKQYTSEDVVEVGLAFEKNDRLIDFFRGRLMFPLIDQRDNVVGFSGRVLDPQVTISKYINTRETLIYHKGEHFYGINITKDAIRRENQAIIVEGEFDLISCFQNGIANVVGVKGTALTENQVNLLARYANKITFCFDGDHAGQEAIKRSLTVVEKKGLTPTVIEIPSGKDPDEALKTEPGLFKKAVKQEKGIYDYLLQKTLSSIDKSSALDKKQASDTLLPIIADIKNEIIKEHYLRKLSHELETSYESIAKELARLHNRKLAPKSPKPAEKPAKRPKEEVMEEYLLALALQNDSPKQVLDIAIPILEKVLKRDRACQKLIHLMYEYLQDTTQFDNKIFIQSLPPELIETYDTCLLFPLPFFSDQTKILQEAQKLAQKLKITYIHQQMKELAQEITHKEEEGKEEVVSKLKKEFSELMKLLDK
jgi:DNA primase